MAIDMTPEQRTQGETNFKKAAQTVEEHVNRRGFMKSTVIGGTALAMGAGAAYFGYKRLSGNPVRAALIGGGDEGGVLVGEHNPDYLQFVACCDVRPTNMTISKDGKGGGRIYAGDPKVGLRKGFKKIYGKDAEKITPYRDYEEMLKKEDVEVVVIALPLHLHAPAAIRAMQIGKEKGKPIHVLCEKLMAWNVKQCKQMIHVAKQTGSILAIGHQRHYSMLYDHAQEVLKAGILGDVKHIRALWHRNFSWPFVADPKGPKQVPESIAIHPKLRDGWYQPVTELDYDELKDSIKKYGYDNVAQLVRWRLHAETGGGLMAELGSHQLDAASIFLGKVKPLCVQGYGATSFFDRLEAGQAPKPGMKNPRNIDDHVFATFTYPGKNHPRNPNGKRNDENDVVVVTYSSVSTNSFEAYGECLMGTRGTMIVEAEQRVMLFNEKNPTQPGNQRMMEVSVESKKAGAPAADATSTWGGPAPMAGAGPKAAAASGPISRGYREEMEDFAYCVRMWDSKLGYSKKDDKYAQRLPRCHGEVAMADAIVALASNAAMAKSKEALKKGQGDTVITFKDEWFSGDSAALPEWDGKEKIDCKIDLK